MAEYTMEELFKMNDKYLDDESIKFEGIDDFEQYYYDRCVEFFDSTYEDVKKLVGKCFVRDDNKVMVKIIGVRDDLKNKYWESCRYWDEFIYEEVQKYSDNKWHFDDYHDLQEDHNDDLAQYRFTPYCDMNVAAEEAYHVGKDGCLYVDYCCDGSYEKFSPVHPAIFDKARAEAVKEYE